MSAVSFAAARPHIVISLSRSAAYHVDDGLPKKYEGMFEITEPSEIDVLVRAHG